MICCRGRGRLWGPPRRALPHETAAQQTTSPDEWRDEPATAGRLDRPPPIDGVSMLDGYLTAVIVGPCSIDPREWLHHMLGPHGRIGMEGTEQSAAIMAIVARFN